MMKRLNGLLIVLSLAMVLAGCTKNDRLVLQQEKEDLGRQLMDEGDYEGAIKAFDDALGCCLGNITNKEIEIDFYKAAALFMSGDNEGALATYSSLIAFDDKRPEPYFLRASVYLKQGESELAVEDYKTAVSLSNSDYDMYIAAYNNLHAAGVENDALNFLKAALELKDKSAESYLARGRIYLILEQYDLAQDQLINAKDKGISDASVYLAQVYQATGATQSAESVLTEYIAEGNTSSEAMNIMAIISMKAGDFQGALNYIAQGLSLEEVTNTQSLLRNKIICLEKTGNFDEAYKTAVSYCELYPKDEDAERELIFLSTRYEGAVEEYYHIQAEKEAEEAEQEAENQETEEQ